MRMIAEATYVCGDPGMQFDTTVNDWHTCPTRRGSTRRTRARSTCSGRLGVQPVVDQPDEVRQGGSPRRRAHAVRRGGLRGLRRTMITAQEIIVDNASYPTKAIEKNHDYRPLGSAREPRALLMSRGLPYDSDAGATTPRRSRRSCTARPTRSRRGRARPRRALRRVREEPGAVPARDAQAPHRAQGIDRTNVPRALYDAAKQIWTRPSSSARITGTATRR